VVTLLLLIFNLILPHIPGIQVFQLPIAMILIIGLLAQFGFLIARYRWRMVTAIASRWLTWRNKDSNIGEKVLIVGTGEGFYSANWLLRQNEYKYVFSIAGLVDDNILKKQGMLIEGCEVLGKIADIPEIIEKKNIGLIVFTSTKVPANIRKYTLDLWKKSKLKILKLDNLSKIIDEQLSASVQSVDNSIWPQNYPMIQPLFDSVTGLPNRFLFQDRLMQSNALAKRYTKEPVMMFIHLDGITQPVGSVDKNIRNDILQLVSERLFKLKRESDTLAYVDKNEFAFILENVQDENAIHLIANRLLSAIQKPVEVGGKSLILHATISISKMESEKHLTRGKQSEELLDFLVDRKVVAIS
ncbi:MAG TPA: diguanylate cyclase, partial [Anaerovoracaceae bacterium]|nr:diguanylate cyclase [Anaerovoracaceae bacterium]